MAKTRSPNYPTLPLGPALEAIRPVFRAENRNKMSKQVLAQHLGYTSLNGRALSKIGAVRAYGLIEGSGDDLRVSEDAIRALTAPIESPDRQQALERLAAKPELFVELRKSYPDTPPSVGNLAYELVQRRFTEDAARKAAQNYLATLNLVNGNLEGYADTSDEDERASEDSGRNRPSTSVPPPVSPPVTSKVRVMATERELTTGLLSKDASFRLIVSGNIGLKEIEMLIKKLQLDKEILADADTGDEAAD